MSRTVEVPQEQYEYRCRVEQGQTMLRRRSRWRMVVERLWMAIPMNMVSSTDWRHHRNGRWRSSEEEARADAERWLDEAEQRAATDDDYV